MVKNHCRNPWGFLDLKALLCKSSHTHSGLFWGEGDLGSTTQSPHSPVLLQQTPGQHCCHRTAVFLTEMLGLTAVLTAGCSIATPGTLWKAPVPPRARGSPEVAGSTGGTGGAVGNPPVQPQARAASS